MNYKQLHLELAQQLARSHDLEPYERETIQQRLHYIEAEYDYRPKYGVEQLRAKQQPKQPKHKSQRPRYKPKR